MSGLHRIVITNEPFGYGFDVQVVPPPAGIGHDREFPGITSARIYAMTLAKATGWRIVDNSGCALPEGGADAA